MSSWDEVFMFLVAFGGGCVFLAGALALFVWLLAKLDEVDRR